MLLKRRGEHRSVAGTGVHPRQQQPAMHHARDAGESPFPEKEESKKKKKVVVSKILLGANGESTKMASGTSRHRLTRRRATDRGRPKAMMPLLREDETAAPYWILVHRMAESLISCEGPSFVHCPPLTLPLFDEVECRHSRLSLRSLICLGLGTHAWDKCYGAAAPRAV